MSAAVYVVLACLAWWLCSVAACAAANRERSGMPQLVAVVWAWAVRRARRTAPKPPRHATTTGKGIAHV